MTIKFINFRSSGNGGDGIRIVGDPEAFDISFEGGTSENNDGHGLHVISAKSIISDLGLPIATDNKLLMDALEEILTRPEQDPHQVILKTGLFEKVLSNLANASSVTANIVSLASSPSVHTALRLLGV